MQVKIFSASDIREVEKEINNWLKTNSKAEVVFVNQSESSDPEKEWSISISIFYNLREAAKTTIQEI